MDRRIVVALAVVVFAAALAFAFQPWGASRPAALGVAAVIPLSGPGAYLGEQARDGIILAAQQANAEGGVNGAPIEVYFEDSKGTAADAVTAYTALKLSRDPQVVLTAFTAPTLALAPLAERDGLPLVSTITSQPNVTVAGATLYRVFTTAEIDAPVSAEFLTARRGFTKFAVVRSSDDYGAAYASAFRRTVERFGGVVVDEETFAAKDSSFKTQLSKAGASGAQAIYFVGVDSHYLIALREARELGLRQALAGNWILASPSVIARANGTADDVFITTPDYYLAGGNTKAASFNADFGSKFGKPADAYAAFGFDAMSLAVAAARQNGTAPAQISYGLDTVRVDGLLGALSFDSRREIGFPLRPAQVVGGKVVPLG